MYGLNQADQSRRGSQGVGFILNQEAIKAWKDGGCELHKTSARIIAFRLLLEDQHKKTVGLFLVSAYAPVGVADETQWDAFLNDLEECVSKKRPDDLLLIGSDTNSSMGCCIGSVDNSRPSLGHFGISHVNDAGRRLSSYLEINNLLTSCNCQ